MTHKNVPLSNYPVFRSADAEFVRNKVLTVYGAKSFELGHGAREFFALSNRLHLKDMWLSYGSSTAAATIEHPEANFIRQIFNIEGSGRYRSGSLSGDMTGACWTPVFPDQAPLVVEFEQGHQHLSLRIGVEGLHRHLNALLGEASDRKLEFLRMASGATRQ